MNNEIKEILVLQNYVNKYKSDEKAIINHCRLTTPLMLDYLEVKNLYNYITNLQQENERLSKELLKYDELLLRRNCSITKAIEYINHTQNYGTMAQVMPHLKPYVNGDDLLNILQNGSDDEC